jgi:hypothetical protein
MYTSFSTDTLNNFKLFFLKNIYISPDFKDMVNKSLETN